MNKLPLLIVVILIGFSCKSYKNKKDTDNIFLNDILNKDYKLWKNEFPDSLTIHFPDKLDKKFISFGSSYRNEPKKFLYLGLEKKLTKEERKKFERKIYTEDTCIIKIYSNKNYYGFNKKGLGECMEYVPVPEFNLVSSLDSVPKDLKYYVLELSHQKFIDHELYLRYYLPDEWRNGMSRGVGISEKENTIFYWLIMW